MSTEEEMYDLIDRCNAYIYNGETKYAGMTYEEGIVAALEWVLGNDADPMDD